MTWKTNMSRRNGDIKEKGENYKKRFLCRQLKNVEKFMAENQCLSLKISKMCSYQSYFCR